MASKGQRSKIDNETRSRRPKALEASKEPRRPKTHWDHVLEEMVWLSKDFEAERKWKVAQAKKVAIRASKGTVDQATRGEKRVKEEEQRSRKVALNITKDVKKFWVKIEKLVLYKHQLELDEKKKKALDKQLEFLLGQTERYSTMLAENLVSTPVVTSLPHPHNAEEQAAQPKEEDYRIGSSAGLNDDQLNSMDIDSDFDVRSEDELEDDEHTIEEDEALITEEERQEELAALQNEADLPLEELLKRYALEKDSQDGSPELDECRAANIQSIEEESESRNGFCSSTKIDKSTIVPGRRCAKSNGCTSISDSEALQVDGLLGSSKQSDKKHVSYDFHEEQEDGDFVLATAEEKDDETTLSEEEELARAESNESIDEIALLQKESEIPIEELLARYKKVREIAEDADSDSVHTSSSEDFTNSGAHVDVVLNQNSLREEDDVFRDLQPVVCSISEKPVEDGVILDDGGDTVFANAAAVHNVESEKPTELPPVIVSNVDEEIESGVVLEDERDNESRIADAAAAARSAQPTGNTFSTTKVRTKFPFLLKYPLREYQHIGLDWLVTMYDKRLNGILADEMGLGKTIMTIALLAHLACEKGIWGPHLIVVPTSVMLNWETEFLKWCPAFKILTYFGSAKERKNKRQGWMKPNYFHVCITTYRLVIQDSKMFKRKKWKYLILDEAHLIKNWKSQRWQTLLNFNSKRRILLTGTPLQNDLMELWSLMHFLMPHVFQSHQEFKDWFCNPISGMVEGQDKVNKEVVDRLHNVLRPFILRRLKRDVEKQLPMKHEHVIYCRLSRRQRNLYEDFIASSETQATLASSNFFGMISVIMQLRKVCNHPDLFEGRPIVSSFDMHGIDVRLSSSICSMLTAGPMSTVNLSGFGFLFTHLDFSMTSWESEEVQRIATPSSLIEERAHRFNVEEVGCGVKHQQVRHGTSIFEEIRKAILEERLREAKERVAAIAWWNTLRCRKKPMYSTTFRSLVTISNPVCDIQHQKGSLPKFSSSKLAEIILSPVERFQKMIDQVESFMFAIPAARAPRPVFWCSKRQNSVFLDPSYERKCTENLSPLLTPLRPAIVRRQLYFPDRRLIQFDCGKLQELAVLLRRLKSEGHRALIFTQMTKMLDVLEAFINLYGYTYMRLDGSTPPEERQTLMQRFNTNPKIFIFILSTRSGGVGINLVGADTVIFYDSDWNPAMDQQAQDRCHRIGQTREVNIYRLISHSTIEENILKKANQKRVLDDLVIQSGGYNTEFFKKLDPMDLFSGLQNVPARSTQKEKNITNGVEASVSNADVEAALKHAEDEADYMALKKVEEEEAVDNQEFTEEAVVRLEDEELIDEIKADEAVVPSGSIEVLSKENSIVLDEAERNEVRALTAVAKEDDVDMLADVKQMAAEAAAAGQTILSFENQLRPIDRYAIRFLELWDPIIDKNIVEPESQFEEADWELDRIEKLKEDMEAEVDEDEEPLVYETWDADFATEAYRQRVEALTQHQLLEDLECEAKEKELADQENSDSMKNDVPSNSKPKPKKKVKKAKFKSLKKGALAESKGVQRQLPNELICFDDEITSHELSTSSERVSVHSSGKKRKAAKDGDEERSSKKPKKFRKINPERGSMLLDSDPPSTQPGEPKDPKVCDNVIDLDNKPANRSRMGGKISITAMPLKRVITIRTEKLKKKGNIWSWECYPSPDVWSAQEDAVLCALVNQYGSHWSLVSETLYGMAAGGFYRGRYRHPVHCCERFRELVQKYVLSAADNTNNEKAGNAGLGKSLIKVTEDNVRVLSEITSELPDEEPLLQKHFFAVLSSVWRTSTNLNQHQNVSSSRNGFHARHRSSMVPPFWLTGKTNFTSLSSKLVAAALCDANSVTMHESLASLNNEGGTSGVGDQLEIILELPVHRDDSVIPIPSPINLYIHGPDPPPSTSTPAETNQHFRSSRSMAENRFRFASTACAEDFVGWASSAFLAGDDRRRTSKPQSLGKHRISSAFESAKSSKSKMRKTAQESSDTHNIAADVRPMLTFPENSFPDPNFDLTLPFTSDFEIGALCDSFWFDMEGVSLETLDVDLVPDYSVPETISGLDVHLSLSDFTDTG